ncbi:MAG: KEOPS complex N(6)-L-threonylcarbamoyladenine synthase Kae1 [archaeon]
MNKIICLGIESTAHTFGASVVDYKGSILSDVRNMYVTDKGGIIPSEAALHHKKCKDKVIEDALKESRLKLEDINIIAFSQGPGLAPSLLVGMEKAKELSLKIKKPLIGVNHITGHLEIGKLLTKAKDPVFVFTSGANTQIIAYEGKKYRIFGEALSIGLGNALDKFGRHIGLGFPAGPKIEELAKKGKYIELPYTVKGMDVDFSGIITKCFDLYKRGISKEDLCYSLQEIGFSMLTEVTERAMAHCNKKEALLIGGVAANKRFCEMLDIMCKEREAKFYPVGLKYSGDQATMIAWTGIIMYKANKKYYDNLKLDDIDINPIWRIDQVDVNWM